MATTAKRLAQNTVAASATTYYTCPASTRAVLGEVILCNTSTTTACTVTLHLVASGGSAGVTNMVLNAYAIGPKETKILALKAVIEAGGTLQALASSAGVVCLTASGIEVAG